MPKIDFGGTEGSSFAPLPKGTYRVRMETMISGKSKSSDNRQLELTMIVDDPDSQYNGRQLKDWFVLTPAAGWKLHGFLDAAMEAITEHSIGFTWSFIGDDEAE